MSLLSLPDELWDSVLSHCSIFDVARAGLTCRQLLAICDSRSIWMAQLQKLDLRSAPDLPPQIVLDSLPTRELKSKVVDATLNSLAWRKRYPLKLSLKNEVQISTDQDDYPWAARLVPGEQMFLVVNHAQLELWSTESKECLWFAEPLSGVQALECVSFEFDVQRDASGAFLMIVAEYTSSFFAVTAIRIFRYNLKDGQGEFVMEKKLPPLLELELTIRGDVVLARLVRMYKVALLDWRERKVVMLDIVDPEVRNYSRRLRAASLSEDGLHLIGVLMFEKRLSVFTLSVAELCMQGSQHEDHKEWPPISVDIKSVTVHPLTHPNIPSSMGREGLRILNMHLFTPTWIPNAPTELYIVTYSRTFADNLLESKHLTSFRLQLRRRQPSSLSPSPSSASSQSGRSNELDLSVVDATQAMTARIPWDPRCITNTGRIICVRDSLRCFSLLDPVSQPIKKFGIENHPWAENDGGEFQPVITLDPIVTTVEPWSGTIAIMMNGTVRLYRVE